MIRRPPKSTLVPCSTLFRSALSLREGLPLRMSAETSVHAPYTVDPESSRLAARRAREREERLATHLSRSEEHTSRLHSRQYLVCRLLLEKNTLLQAAPQRST